MDLQIQKKYSHKVDANFVCLVHLEMLHEFRKKVMKTKKRNIHDISRRQMDRKRNPGLKDCVVLTLSVPRGVLRSHGSIRHPWDLRSLRKPPKEILV